MNISSKVNNLEGLKRSLSITADKNEYINEFNKGLGKYKALYLPSPLLNSLIYSFLSAVIDKDLLSPSKLFTFEEIFIIFNSYTS